MELLRRDPYVIEVDRGRNCYACSRFGHMARYCKNRKGRIRTGESRRLEYRRKENFEQSDNLKEKENLVSLD